MTDQVDSDLYRTAAINDLNSIFRACGSISEFFQTNKITKTVKRPKVANKI